MYVFPGGQGDCALFGVTGFTLLVDGGFARKPCFWEFVRHLDRLDSLLVTRFNQFNSCGLTALAQRKALERVYPQVGHVFCNAVRSPSDEELQKDRDQLLVSVVAQGLEFLQGVREMGLSPQACQRDARPLTLFHKVGQGTLEMFVLSPGRVTEEDTSVCVLLVWRPSKASEPVTRILLPGSAPQSVIFDGLSKLGHLAVLRSRAVTAEERLGLKRSKVQDKPLRATSVPPRPSVAKRATAKGESPSPSPTPPLPEKTRPKVHTNRSVDSLPKKQDEGKRPPAKPTKREPRKAAADKSDAKEEKVAKITAKVAAKVAETTPDKEKLVEKLGENEVDKVEEKDISKIIGDKPLKKLPVEIGKIDPKAQEEIVAKVEEKVTVKRELKKATPTRPPAKSKGAKDVTNKMAVEGKTVARKTAEPTKAKPRPVVAPPTRPMVRDSRSKSPSSSASSSPKRAPPKPASERPVRSVRGGVRTAKPTLTEPAKVTEGEKPVVTEKPTAQVKPDKRIEIVTQSGDESSGSKEAIEEKAATEATKEDKPFIEPSSSDESKKDAEKQKPAAIVDELPIKAVLLGTMHAAALDEDVQKAPMRPFEKEIADAEMWPTAGDAKEIPEPPGLALSPEPTISASSEGVPSLVDEVIDVSLQADSSVARPIAEPDLSQVRALSSGQRTPDSLDTPREVGDGTAPSSRDEILDAMEKHRLVSREQVLEIKRRDSVDSIEGEIAAEEEDVPHDAEETEKKEIEKLPQPILADKTTSDVMPATQERPSDVAPSDTAPKPAETKEADLQGEPTLDVPVSIDSVKQSIELPSYALEGALDETKPAQLDEVIPEPPDRLDDEKAKAAAASVPESAEEIVAKHVAEKAVTLPVGEAPAVGEIKADDIQEKQLTEHAVLPRPEEPEQDAATALESPEKILPKDLKEPPPAEGLKLPADDTHIHDEINEREHKIKPVAERDVVLPKHGEPDVLESATTDTAGITAATSEQLKVEPQLQKQEEPISELTPAVAERRPDELEPSELKEPTAEPLVSLQPELAVPFMPEVSAAKPAESENALKETPQLEKSEPHTLQLSPTAGERERSKTEPAELEEIRSEPPSPLPHKEAEVPVSAETEVEQKAPLIDDLSQKEAQLKKGEDVAREHILSLGVGRTLGELKPDMPAEPMAETIVSAEHREPDAAVSAFPEGAGVVAAEPEYLEEKEPLLEKPEKHIRDLPSPTVQEQKLDSEAEREAPAALPKHTEAETTVSPAPKDEKAKPDDVQAQEPRSDKIDDHDRDLSPPTAGKPEAVEIKPSEVPEAKLEPAVLPKHEAPETAEKADIEPEDLGKIEPDLKKLEDQDTDRVSPTVTEYAPSETDQKEPEKLRAEPAALPEHEEPEPTISPLPEVVDKMPPEQDYLKKQEPHSELKEDLGSELPPLAADEHKAGELKPLEKAESKPEPSVVTDRDEVEPAVSPVSDLAAEKAAEPSDVKMKAPHVERPEDHHRDFPLSDQMATTEQLKATVSPAREGVEKAAAAPEDAIDSEVHIKKPEDYDRDLPSPSVRDHKVDGLMPGDREATMEPTPQAEHAKPEPHVSRVPEADEKAAAKLQDAKEKEPHLEEPGDFGRDIPSPSVDEHKPEKSQPAEKEPEAVPAVASELKEPEAAVSAITEPTGKAGVEPQYLKEEEQHREKPEDHGIDLTSPAAAAHKLSEVKTAKPDESKAVQELLPEHEATPVVSPAAEVAEKTAAEKGLTEQEPQTKKEDHGQELPEPSVDAKKPEKLLPTETESEEEPAAASELKEAKVAVSPVTDAAGKTTDEPEEKEPQREKPQDHDIDLGSAAVIEHKPSEVKTTEPEDFVKEPASSGHEELEPAVSPVSEMSDKMAPDREDVTKEEPLLERKEDHDGDLSEPSVDEYKPEKLLPTETEPKAELAAAPKLKEPEAALSPATEAAGETPSEPEDIKEKEPHKAKHEERGVDLESPAVAEHKPSEIREPEKTSAELGALHGYEEPMPVVSPAGDVADKMAPQKEDIAEEKPHLEKEDDGRDLQAPSVEEHEPKTITPADAEPKPEPSLIAGHDELKAAVRPVTEDAGKAAAKTNDLEEKEPQRKKREDHGTDIELPTLGEPKPSEMKRAEPEEVKLEPVSSPEHKEYTPVESHMADVSDKTVPERKDLTEEPHLEERVDSGLDLAERPIDELIPGKSLPTEIEPKVGPAVTPDLEEPKAAVSTVTEAPEKKSAEPEGLKGEEPHWDKPEERIVALEPPAVAGRKPSESVTEPEKKPAEGGALPEFEEPEPVASRAGDVAEKVSPVKEDITKEQPHLEKKEDDRLHLPASAVDEHEPEKVKPADTEPKAEPPLVAEHDELEAAVAPVIEAVRETAAEPKDLKEKEPQREKSDDHGADLESPATGVHELSEVKTTEPEEVRAEPGPSPEHKESKPLVSPMAEILDKTAPERKDLTEEEPPLEKKEDHGLDLAVPSIDKLMTGKLLPTETELEVEPTDARELEEPKAAASTEAEPPGKKAAEAESLKEEEPHLEKPEEPAALPKHEVPKSAVSPVPAVAEKLSPGRQDLTKEQLDIALKEDSNIPSPAFKEHETGELKPSDGEPKAELAAVPMVEEPKTAFSPVAESPEKKGAEREDRKEREPHFEKPGDRGFGLESPAVPEHQPSETKAAEPVEPRVEPASLFEREAPKPAMSPMTDITEKAAPKAEDFKEQKPDFEEEDVDGRDIAPLSPHDRKPDELKTTDVGKAVEPAIFPGHEKPQAAISPLLEPEDVVAAQPEQIKEQEIYTKKPEEEAVSEPEVVKKEPRFDEPGDHDHDIRLPAVDEHEAGKMKTAEPKDMEATSAAFPQREKPDGAASPLPGVPAKSSPEPQHLKSEEPHLEETQLHDSGLASPAIDSHKPDELKLAEFEEPKPEPAVLPGHEKPQAAAVLPSEMAPKTGTVCEDLTTQKPDLQKLESPALDGHKYGELMPADFDQTIEKATAPPEHKEPGTAMSPLREVADKTVAEPEDLKKLDYHFEKPDHDRDLSPPAADEKLSHVKPTEPEAKLPDIADHKVVEEALSPMPDASDKAASQPGDLQNQEPKMEDMHDRVRDFPSPTADDHKPGELKPTEMDASKADSAVLPEHEKSEAATSPILEVLEKTPTQPEDFKKQEPHPEKLDDRLRDLPLASLEHEVCEFKPLKRKEAGEKPVVFADQAQPEASPSPEPMVDEKLVAKTEETKEQKPHVKEPEGDGLDLPSQAAVEHKPSELKSTAFEPETKTAVMPGQEEHKVPVSPVAKGTDRIVSEPEDLQKKEAQVEELEKHGIEPAVSSLPEAAGQLAPKREDSKQEPPSEKEDQYHETLSLAADEHEVDAFKPADTPALKAEPGVVPERKEPEAAVRPMSAVAEKVAAQPEDLQKQEPQLERPEDYGRDLSITGADEHKADDFKTDELEHVRAEPAVVTEKVKPEAPASPVPKVAEGKAPQYEHDKQQEPLLEKTDHAPFIPSPTLDEHEPAQLKPAGREELRVEPELIPEHKQPEVSIIPAPKDTDIAASKPEEDRKQEPHLGKPEDLGHDMAPPPVDKHKPGELKPDVTKDAGSKTSASEDHEEPKGGASRIPEAKEEQLAATEVAKKDEAHLEKPVDLVRELPSPAVDELKPGEVKSTELGEPKAQPTELPKHEKPDVVSSPVMEAAEKPSLETADLEHEKLRLEKPELPRSVIEEHELDRVKPDEPEKPISGRVLSEHKDPDTAVFPVPEAAEKEAATSEDLKILEPHLGRPVDESRESPLPTVDKRKPEERKPDEPHELDAEPAAFLQQKMPEVASSHLSEVAEKKVVAPDHDKRQEPELEKPEDRVSDLPPHAVQEPRSEDLKPLESKEVETGPSISSALKEPIETEPPAQKVAQKSVLDDLKTQEPDFEKPEDHVRGDHKLDEIRTPEIQDLEARTAILHDHKEPEDSGPGTTVADKTPAGIEDLKAKEPRMEKPEDHGSDIPLPGLKDKIASEFKPVEFEETKKEPVFADHKEPEAALHSEPKVTDKPPAVPEDLKDQERYFEKPEEPTRDISSTTDQRILDDLTLAKHEDQKPEPDVFLEHKEPVSVLRPVPEDMDKKAAIIEALQKQEPNLEQQKDRAHELQSTPLDADKPGDFKPAQLEVKHKEPEVPVSTTPEIADKSMAAPEDLKKQEPPWERPRDESHDHVSALDKPEAREFLPADLEGRSAESAVVPEYKDTQARLSAVPDAVDTLAASPEDLKMSAPPKEDLDHSPVFDGHKYGEIREAKADEPVRTPAVFPDHEQHEAALVTVPVVAEKKEAAPEFPEEDATYMEEPEDHRGTASSSGVDERKPQEPETAEFQKPEEEPLLFEQKESVVASSPVPQVTDSKATAHDLEQKPQLQKPEHSGRDSPSADDEHKTAEHKPAVLKEQEAESGALTEFKQPETPGIEVPGHVDKKASVPEEVREQELRVEQPGEYGRDFPSPAFDEHKLDGHKHDDLEPATSPHRHEPEVHLVQDVKPDTGKSPSEVPVIHEREPGAEPPGKLPQRSSSDAKGIVTSPGEETVVETAGSVKDDRDARKSIAEIQEIEDYETRAEKADLQAIVTSPLHSVIDDAQRLPVDSEDDEQREGIRITELPGVHQKELICKAGQELPSDDLKGRDQTQLQDTAGDRLSETDSSDATSIKPEVPRSSYVSEDYEALAATTLIPEVDGTIAEDLIAAKEKAQQQLQDYPKDGTPTLVSPASLIESDVTLESSTKDVSAQLGEALPHFAETSKDFPGIERVSELIDDGFDPAKQTSQQPFQDRSKEALSSDDRSRSAQPGSDQGIQLPSDSKEHTDSSEDVRDAHKTEPDKTTALPHDQACFEDGREVMRVVEALPKSPELKKDLPTSEGPEAKATEPLTQQSTDGLHEVKPDITDKEPFSSAETCPPASKPTGSEVAEAVSHDSLKDGQAEHVLAPKDHECSIQESAPGATAAAPVESPQAEYGQMALTEDTKRSDKREPSLPLSEIEGSPSGESLPGTTQTDAATSLPAPSERSKIDTEPAKPPSGRTDDVRESSEVPDKEKPQDKCPTPEQVELPQPTDSSSAGIVEMPLYPTAKPYDTQSQIASQEDRGIPDSKAKRDTLQDTQTESVTHKDTTPLDAFLEPRKETELHTDAVKEGAQPSIVKKKADVEDAFPLQPEKKAQEVPEDACLKLTDASMPKDDAASNILAPDTKGDEGRAPTTTTKDLESDFCREESTLPCDASVLAKMTTAITVEREVIKQDLHLPLETPAPVGGVYSKARELLDECVSGADSTSPGGAVSTGSPKSSVSEESVPSVVPKDEGKDASAKEKEHDDKTSDEDIAPCSGCTTGYDFRSPSEVLKRDFLEETSNTLGKEVDMSMVMLSPSQDEEGRRLLEIIKSQLICEHSTHFEVTTGKQGLPETKDIPPADSTIDITDRHIAGSGVEETKLARELIEKDDEMLPHIIDEITKEESHDLTLAVPQKLQVLEDTTEKPFSFSRDDTAEPSSHADVPVSSQGQRKLSSPEKLLSEGTPQDKESSCTPSSSAFEKAHGDLQDETRLDRPTEDFQDTPQESSTRESKPVDQVSSDIAGDKSSKPEIQASQAPIATESFRTPEDSGHPVPLDFDGTPAKDLGSSPVTLKESTEIPEMALARSKDKEPGGTCEAPSYYSEIALTKGIIFDARLSSGSEGTKARGEAQFGEDPSVFSPSLTPQKQDRYDPETPWAEHATPRRDSREVPPLEIQDQPMKDPRATYPTALDTPELAHMQQRLSVEYESSITSVSEIEFTVDAKSSGAQPSDSSSRDDSKAPGVSEDERDTSRASSPESPPQSPVKRMATEHPRPSKRSRTASESKHTISTQGSSEADISSEDEDSAKKGLSQHHTPASADGGNIRKESVTPLLQADGAQDIGDTSSAPSETSRPRASRPSLETETTSSSDDATSGPTSGTTSKDSESMREYSKHLETSPGSRFSLDSTCSVTSEERSYAELEKPYQRDYSQESFSSTTRECPQDSSRSGSLYSDSTLEPLSTVGHYEAGRSDTTSPTAEGQRQVATIPHSHGIASGLFAALKTELCVIDSPSMDSVLDQTGKDAEPLSDQPTCFTSPKVTEGDKEPSAIGIKQPESEQETLSDDVQIDSGKEDESAQRYLPEAPEEVSDKEPRKTHPVPLLTSEKTQPASGSEAAFDGDVEPLVARKISGEITPSKTLRFQLPEEPVKEGLTDQSAKDSAASRALLDDSQSKEMFERAVRLEQLNEAEFLEYMATDEEDDLSRASLKPSSSTAASSRHGDSQKSAEPDDDATEDDVTLASALSSGLPTELVCMAQSSVDISKDISRIAKCTDSLELATSPPHSPQDAGKHDEPAAVAAGLASGLPVELVCMVESKELLSEIKRAEEEAIHLVIEKKADYTEEGSGAAMQTYIERRLSDSDHCTDKQPLASPTLKAEPTSKTGEPTPGQRSGKEFDDLHLNGTSHSPPSVGLVAGLAAGLATELVCMPQSAEELCIEAAESSRSPRGSQADVTPPEMTASMYEERTGHLDEKLTSDADGVEYSGQGVPESIVPPRMGQIPVQREVITTVTSRRVVYQSDGPPDTWTTSTLSDAPQHDAEDDSKRTTVTYVYRTYTSDEGDDKEGPVISSGSVPSRIDEDGVPFDILRSRIARHAREEETNLEGDQVTGPTTRRYVYTVSSDQGTPEMFIRQSDDSDTASHLDSSIHSIAMDEVARITEMAAAAVSQSPNGWTVVHRSADSSSQRPLELTRPTEFVDRRNGHVTHVTETRQIVYHPSSSGELHFPLGRSAEETCLPPEGSDPKTILEFMAAQTKQAAKEMLEEQPLYEEDEEAALEQSSLSDASPLVEEPVFAKTLQPDYPELVELSAGNTPSEPPSPHSAVHDARARHNGEPGVTSVQRMVVVEETEPLSTPGRSQARRVVSYVEEPTTVVREEWVLEGGHGDAPQVISQSSMFHHEILTVDGSTSTTPSHTSGVDPVRFTHHFERDIGAADDVLQQSSLKASAAVHGQQERSRGAAESTGPTIAATTTSLRQDAVRELQAATERQANGRRDGDTAPFDIRDWGKPLGLPVPPDPSSKSASKTGRKAAPRNASDVVYVDLTYVPHHGDPGYCDAEFFSRVRARYYVLSGTNPSQQVLDALLEAKRGWGEPDAPVTVIPTYETDALCYWIAHNQKALEEHHIDVAPSASRCTINLQDHESSCAAYRLEF